MSKQLFIECVDNGWVLTVNDGYVQKDVYITAEELLKAVAEATRKSGLPWIDRIEIHYEGVK